MTHRKIMARIVKEAKEKILEETGQNVVLSIVHSQKASQVGAEMLLLEMCSRWGITPEWLRIPSRSQDRPIMRKIFWVAAKTNYPQVTYRAIAELAGVSNHVTTIKGILAANTWRSVNDPSFMKYYNQISHLIEN